MQTNLHRVLTPACLLIALAAPLSAQEKPQGSFSWAVQPTDLGTVAAPAVELDESWRPGPYGISYRAVPTFSGDPTVEVIFPPVVSGHPTSYERALVQFPASFLERDQRERAVAIGFHSFGVSEKDIFLNSQLPWECKRRGWMLIAPYGLSDTNFANPASQESLETLLRVIYQVVPFNYRRIYTVGFSMGGLSAMSFAMRHQDPLGVRVAGVVSHTGPVDLVRQHADGALNMQLLLEQKWHFAGSPDVNPFAYDRVSPARFDDFGSIDPERAPVVNLHDVRVFLHANLADPNTQLLQDSLDLKEFLMTRGARVQEHLTTDPVFGHDWRTLPLRDALDFVATSTQDEIPLTAEVFVDRPTGHGATEVRELPWDTHARYRVEVAPEDLGANSFRLDKTRNLIEVAVRTEMLGLDPTAPLVFQVESADGTGDTIVLTGYELPPRSVRSSTVALPWTWDMNPRELRIETPDDGSAVTVEVQP